MLRVFHLTLPLLLLSCALCANAAPQAVAAPKPSMIVAEPAVATPGQTVTLRWFFTGSKVLLTGGKFRKGLVVTGKQRQSDRIYKDTTYNIDVWYRGDAPTANGTRKVVPLHQRYSVTVPVALLNTYSSDNGWKVNFLRGWKTDKLTRKIDPNDELLYFQKEDDSIERLSVAIIPAKGMDVQGVLEGMSRDIAERYTSAQIDIPRKITCCNIPAMETTFSGVTMAHPGINLTSTVVAFVRDGRAYIISARTASNQYPKRQKLMEHLVHSFFLKGSGLKTISL